VTQAQAVKEVVAWQLTEARKKRKISKTKMAMLLKTSLTQVDRLLDAKNDITLSSLQRAAAILGVASRRSSWCKTCGTVPSDQRTVRFCR
jgi:transcriptional regulator with XRE-family HTH domain